MKKCKWNITKEDEKLYLNIMHEDEFGYSLCVLYKIPYDEIKEKCDKIKITS